MPHRSEVLDLAILGRLADGPLHGYELRKRIMADIGIFHTLSFGSLYPRLRSLVERGLIGSTDLAAPPHALAGRRSRIVYELTGTGKEFLAATLAARTRRRGTTTSSTCGSRCSPTPTPPPGCASWKAVAPASWNGAKPHAARTRRTASAATPTPWSSSDTVWSCSTPSWGGWTASSPPNATGPPPRPSPPPQRPHPRRRPARRHLRANPLTNPTPAPDGAVRRRDSHATVPTQKEYP